MPSPYYLKHISLGGNHHIDLVVTDSVGIEVVEISVLIGVHLLAFIIFASVVSGSLRIHAWDRAADGFMNSHVTDLGTLNWEKHFLLKRYLLVGHSHSNSNAIMCVFRELLLLNSMRAGVLSLTIRRNLPEGRWRSIHSVSWGASLLLIETVTDYFYLNAKETIEVKSIFAGQRGLCALNLLCLYQAWLSRSFYSLLVAEV
jgi:hypothetical protein